MTQIPENQQKEIDQLLDGLFYSPPGYWKYLDGKASRVKARAILKEIVGVTPKQAQRILRNANIPVKEMPIIPEANAEEVNQLFSGLFRDNQHLHWKMIDNNPIKIIVSEELASLGVKHNRVASVIAGANVPSRPFPGVKSRKSQRQIVEILTVDAATVNRDLSVANATKQIEVPKEADSRNVANATNKDPAKAIEKEMAAKKKRPGPPPKSDDDREEEAFQKLSKGEKDRYCIIQTSSGLYGIYNACDSTTHIVGRSKGDVIAYLNKVKRDKELWNCLFWQSSKAKNECD